MGPNPVRPRPFRVEHAMNLLSPDLETASPACHFTANWEPTLDEILEEPIVRQLMARDGVTEPILRRLANMNSESLMYRPQLVRHLIACYAASTAGESWFCRTAAGVWNP